MSEEKLKLAPQETPEHVYVVAYDTVCTGWDCWKTEDDEENPIICLLTKAEAEAELIDDTKHERNSCKEKAKIDGEGWCDVKETGTCTCETTSFMVHMNQYLHGRKTMLTSNGIQIEGTKP